MYSQLKILFILAFLILQVFICLLIGRCCIIHSLKLVIKADNDEKYLLNRAAIFLLKVKNKRQISGIFCVVDISVTTVCIRKNFLGCRIRQEYAHCVILFDYSGNSDGHKTCVSPFFTNTCSKYFRIRKFLKIYEKTHKKYVK